jgi:cyclopropane-fatty-acyl-phospholipid synthase
MTDQKDLEYTYTLFDKIFRHSIGEMADFSGAMYNGDFSLSLEQAQRNKHEFITKSLNIKEDSKVLDMGCGWGPYLRHLEERGAKGIGVTLSTAQAEACVKNGLDVHLMDCRTISPAMFGKFDAIVSLGAFEHHCSRKEWDDGKQNTIYNNFFRNVSDLLHEKKRFYLQTMTYGKNMIDADEIDINAEKGSDSHICALVERRFPGSWLASGSAQIIECAKPFFKLISTSNGRLDYLETLRQWGKKGWDFSFKKYLLYGTLIPKYLMNRDFRKRLDLNAKNPHRLCFEREIIDHWRFVFEKVT